MMTAPMIFYILSNIPLHIPDKYFEDLDFLIRQFFGGSSPHRLSIKKLQASAKQGGFSLPNFQWYYWVMNVKQLRAWLPTAPVKPIWSHIETEVNGGISPWRELFDTSHKTTHPIIANAKTLWCKLHRAGCWDFIKSPSATLWGNKRILIGGTSVDWLQWRKAGILNVSDLFDCGTKCFLSFDKIVELYKLKRNQFWRYVQIHSSLSKWLGTPLSCPVGSPVEVLLSRSSLGKGITSRIYHLLQERSADPLLKVKGYWAQDMALDISSVEWDSCFQNVNTMYKETGSRFIQLKIIHRWHRTPQQLYKWNLAPTDKCWRCDGQNASILHILWSCSALRVWWENIMEVIFKHEEKNIVYIHIFICCRNAPTCLPC
uniref:Reverse transcriptase zinc-binding domain-containing protein n=1 Tax=Neolamprologus brichardi TaxID=32507 RepID=A0A3Q4HZV5_NEOBR